MPFTWEDIFDRMGGLWTAVAAIVGFWVANQFELRRDARQAVRDHDRERRASQQATIRDLQHALQELSDSTGAVATYLPEVLSGLYPTGKLGPLGEPWYIRWEAAVQNVSVLTTRLESPPLVEKVMKVMFQGSAMVAAAQAPLDFEALQIGIERFRSANSQLKILTKDAQDFAGLLYQELNRPTETPDDRSWLCRRIC